MEKRTAETPLGVPGELAVLEGEVGRLDGHVRDGERIRERAQKRCVTACDLGKAGTRLERENQGDVEAAGAEDDRSASGVAAENRNTADRAGIEVRPGVRRTVAGQYDSGMSGFPDEKVLPRRPVTGAVDVRENLPFLVNSTVGWHQPEIGQLHGGWRYNPDTRR